MKVIILGVLLFVTSTTWAISPYTLASETHGVDARAKAIEVKETLNKAGLRVVGMYSPLKGRWVLAITSHSLQSIASKSKHGGFGAVLRVGITKVKDKIQVSYSNPEYWKHAFRLNGDVSALSKTLEKTLGKIKDFPATDITTKKLRKYHYMAMMPYFDDQDKLASYDTHEKAVAAVEAGLKAHRGGSKKVYRVKIPGKNDVVYGVQLYKGCGAESNVMKYVDKSSMKSTPHLPYQILVSDNTVWALRGRFRIAVAFPNLSMGTFMKIRCAPGAIQDALEAVAENKDD